MQSENKTLRKREDFLFTLSPLVLLPQWHVTNHSKWQSFKNLIRPTHRMRHVMGRNGIGGYV
ncbi:hypothetical protein PUN28_012367 [Cardiocondyla obscurior]|uniref:Uncharacterized protein n=1 Tax=Cardiocondyla obscurior TaxID=286306 RepID=A0AAW2FEX9_9HYME